MARPEGGGRSLFVGLAVVAVAAVAIALAVVLSGEPPDGPVAVDWDGTRCARCGMLVSEPSFAAQLHLEDGEVEHFDDPGCLLARLEQVPPARVHAAWLHHHAEDRWLPLDRSAFVRVPHSPMGYGLGVVERGSEGALDLEAARARMAEVDRAAPGAAAVGEGAP